MEKRKKPSLIEIRQHGPGQSAYHVTPQGQFGCQRIIRNQAGDVVQFRHMDLIGYGPDGHPKLKDHG